MEKFVIELSEEALFDIYISLNLQLENEKEKLKNMTPKNALEFSEYFMTTSVVQTLTSTIYDFERANDPEKVKRWKTSISKA